MADPSTPYIGSGLPAKIVETDGITTLFRYAARELGDALAWWQIAELNGLSDPWVGAGISLLIPAKGQASYDGLPLA